MLHSISAPNMGHPIVHHFAEGAAVWGQQISPSISHLIQGARILKLSYASIGPGITFQAIIGTASLAHVTDPLTIDLSVDERPLRRALRNAQEPIATTIFCQVGDGCELRLWGRVARTDTANQDFIREKVSGTSVPARFLVSFWEISRCHDTEAEDVQSLRQEIEEKKSYIRALEMKAALAACAQ